jgi:hypothetical protein
MSCERHSSVLALLQVQQCWVTTTMSLTDRRSEGSGCGGAMTHGLGMDSHMYMLPAWYQHCIVLLL